MIIKQICTKYLNVKIKDRKKLKFYLNNSFSFYDNIIKVDYNDLIKSKDKNLISNSIEKAYNKDGLGILIVQNVPNYYNAKINLFKENYNLVNLPKTILNKLERPEIQYSLGYSFGKEMFNDKPDIYKASFYVNIPKENEKTSIKNIWPNELPELENKVNNLSNIIRQVGYELLRNIDIYIKSKFNDYNLNYADIIKYSQHNTGRLLYYFPKNKVPNKTDNEENWCAWHNDHGSLTGLASACYIDSETGLLLNNLKSEKTGLYIQSRKGEIVKVNIGQEDIAFQLGETLQIHSGGLLHATPHAVKIYNDIPDKIARCTYALFMEPNRDCDLTLPKGTNLNDISTSDVYSVPKLQDRFKQGMNFGEFCDATNAAFYKDNK